MEFRYVVFTRMPGESDRRRLSSLLVYLCYVFRALINSLVDSARTLWAWLFPICVKLCTLDRRLPLPRASPRLQLSRSDGNRRLTGLIIVVMQIVPL